MFAAVSAQNYSFFPDTYIWIGLNLLVHLISFPSIEHSSKPESKLSWQDILRKVVFIAYVNMFTVIPTYFPYSTMYDEFCVTTQRLSHWNRLYTPELWSCVIDRSVCVWLENACNLLISCEICSDCMLSYETCIQFSSGDDRNWEMTTAERNLMGFCVQCYISYI